MARKGSTYMYRAICLVLSIVLLLSMAGCKNSEEAKENGDTFVVADPTTDTYVVKNGISPYKILIPENASTQLQFAATDFQFFFKEATGVELEIVTKAENLQGKYFSIGPTAITQAAGVSNTYDELGMDGYRVKTYGDAIVMIGENDKSSSFAIYGYLAKQFGLEIYADDVYQIYPTSNAKLLDLDWTDLPDIPVRNGGVGQKSWYGTTEYMTRMKFRNMGEFWGLTGHTFFTILPPSEYLADHPDWYDDAESPLEICKTNEEMKAQFIENLKQIILDKPNHRFFMLGHEDGGPMCKCDDCQAVRDQYDGSNSALEVLFLNDVVRSINEWAAVECPERVLEFCMFAYTTTEAPPTTYDQTTKTYSPINNAQELMLEHNLGVQIAPIGTPVSVAYMDQGYTAAIFGGWAALTDSFYLWGYCCPFGNYLSPFDCFGAYAQNYRDYVEIGAKYVFDQGFAGSYTHNFVDLRDYLASKLMWDTTLDETELIQDFMKHYYGPGWKYVYEFFVQWRIRMTELKEFGMDSFTASQLCQDWCQPDLYPKALLDQYEMILDKAFAENESIKESDPEKYEFYLNNIRSVRCNVRYLTLSIYPNYYDYDSYKAMIDEFVDISSLMGMLRVAEGGRTLADQVAVWNENLSQK